MLQLRRDLDFPKESFPAEHRRQLRMEDFDRDLAVVLHVLGEIDRGHPAAAQLPLDRVSVGQGGAQTIQRLSDGLALEWGDSQRYDKAVRR